MSNVSLAEAKAHLSELVERAAAGDRICITRRGRPVAQLTAVTGKRAPIDVAEMRALTDTMPVQTEPAGEMVRRMRDDDRY